MATRSSAIERFAQARSRGRPARSCWSSCPGTRPPPRLCHTAAPSARRARRYGLLGGLVVGAAWLLGIAPLFDLGATAWVLVPLLVALLVPAAVATLAAGSNQDPRAGTGAALWTGVIGGHLVFVVVVTAAYVSDGRPHDPQMIRDFHHSGAHDLAAYAVSDALGGALGMLLIIPPVAIALGTLGGRIAVRHGP